MTNRVQTEVYDLYSKLGITSPAEIDLEAIAFYLKAEVKQKSLSGCEARIIGLGDRAIITVNEQSSNERQRFSIGHELGHWLKHKGQVGNICTKEQMDSRNKNNGKEKIANQIASELLLPTHLISPFVDGRPVDMDLIRDIKGTFNVSLLASAIRAITANLHMGFFAVYDGQGNRRYFVKHKDLPWDFGPPESAPKGSVVRGLIRDKGSSGQEEVDGDVWTRQDALDVTVHEQAFHYYNGSYITLVWWHDEEPIWKHIHEREEYQSRRGR